MISTIHKLAAALAVVALALAVGAAQGHAQTDAVEPPGPSERGIALASPGVVFIGTSGAVTIKASWQDVESLSGRGSSTEAFAFEWGTGSGFVVHPDGTIVTATHVIKPGRQSLRNYAANMWFFGTDAWESDDPFEQYYTGDPILDQWLDQCYAGVTCSFETNVEIEVFSAVSIAGIEAPKGMPARVLRATPPEKTDIAVLQVDGEGMATVALAETARDVESGDEIVALGFAGSAQHLPTGVTEPTKLFGRVSNIRSAGSSRDIEVDVDIEGGMSGGPVIDSSGRVIGLTSYSGLEGEQRTQGYVKSVDDIRSTLSDAGIDTERGPVDAAFAEALDLYWGRHYTPAVEAFEKVLALSDAHPLAKRFLAKAQEGAGTPEEVPLPAPESSGGLPLWLFAAAALALAGSVGGGLAGARVLRRRRRATAPAITVATAPGGPSSNGRVADPFHIPAYEEGTAGEPARVTVGAATALADPQREFCTGCGTNLDADARFCGACGRPAER